MEYLFLASFVILFIIYYKVFRIASDLKEIKELMKKQNTEELK